MNFSLSAQNCRNDNVALETCAGMSILTMTYLREGYASFLIKQKEGHILSKCT